MTIILPGTPEFDWTLGRNLPPNWQQVAGQHHGAFHFVARAGSGLLEPVGIDEFEEYLEGGEYDERLAEMGDEDDFEEFDEEFDELCLGEL
jgi:hypothetical protein